MKIVCANYKRCPVSGDCRKGAVTSCSKYVPKAKAPTAADIIQQANLKRIAKAKEASK